MTPETVQGDVPQIGPDQAELALKITPFPEHSQRGEDGLGPLRREPRSGSPLCPFSFGPTVARPAPHQFAKKQERWQKIVTAAAKQSGRGLIPTVHPVTPWSAMPRLLTEHFTLVAWEGETTCSPPAGPILTGAVDRCAVGHRPGRGFSSEEVEALVHQGALSVSLGPRTLRAETAGPLAAGLLLYHYGALEPAPSTFPTTVGSVGRLLFAVCFGSVYTSSGRYKRPTLTRRTRTRGRNLS